eukprot:15227491-Ditylum_brightwellii.AAC.1
MESCGKIEEMGEPFLFLSQCCLPPASFDIAFSSFDSGGSKASSCCVKLRVTEGGSVWFCVLFYAKSVLEMTNEA